MKSNNQQPDEEIKYSTISSSFEAIDLPSISEVRGKGYMKFGKENKFPDTLISLFNTSAMHHAAIVSIVAGITGNGIETYGGIIVNPDGDTLEDILDRVALDHTIIGAYALNVVWNKAGSKIVELYHIPVSKIRVGIPNDDDKITSYYYSSNWSKIRKHPAIEYPAFNATDNRKDNASQIFYFKDYQPGNDVYAFPSYIGGLNDIQLDARISVFHNANISNGLSPGMILNFKNGIPSPEEIRTMHNDITRAFSGENNAGKFFLNFSDPETGLDVVTIDNANDDYYITLEQRVSSRILTAHRITSPLLLGIKDGSGFSSNADEIKVAYQHFMGTVLEPKQKKILSNINFLFKFMGYNVNLDVIQSKIVSDTPEPTINI